MVQAATALQASSRGEQQDIDAAAQLKDSLTAHDSQIAELTDRAETLRVRTDQFRAGGHRLAQVQERLRSVSSLAAERTRSLQSSATVDYSTGRDPQQLRDQADQVGEEAAAQQQQVEVTTAELETTSTSRAEAEEMLKTEESRITEQLRAVADRRAGLATLHGRVETAQGRVDAAQSRRRRAQDQHDAEQAAVEESRAELADFEQRLAGVETDGPGFEEAYQAAQTHHGELRAEYEEQAAQQRRLEIAVSEYRARLSGLQAARSPKDGAAALDEQDAEWVTGAYADSLKVQRGWETAVAAVLGSLDSALVVSDSQAASSAVAWLGDNNAGRAHLVYPQTVQSNDYPTDSLPSGARWALEVITVPAELAAPLVSALTGVAVVADESAGEELLGTAGVTSAVTADGVILRAGERIGGAAVENAEIAINAQMDELSSQIHVAEKDLQHVTEQTQRSQTEVTAAELEVNQTLEAMQANETQLVSTSDQLKRLKAEIERSQQRVSGFAQEIQDAETAAADAAEQLDEITSRLEAAENEELVEEPSTAERDRLTEAASAARREEVDARLAVRAAEEELKQLQERVASLRRSAQAEEHRREQARRAAQARSERAQQAEAVRVEADEAIEIITAQLAQTRAAQQTAGDRHTAVKTQISELTQVRTGQSKQLEEITSRLHQAELKQTELRLAMEAAEVRAGEELSLTPEYLIEHYGPDQPVPDVDSASEDEEEVTGAPYVHEEQEARLGRARRDLKALGKVNPLALEEYAALEERHTYLQGQLADLKKSRQDLMDIIAEVDAEVHKVFTAAWEDTRVQFERVFARLFPGGEGRLELTNPEDMLNTGIEVHARPPGKRIRRLSLLSGGERSLTAVALLVAIFKARPSPFYVMDEVEAALDDTNLSRLLVIFDELRETSQLIVITHQKRTMEIADALYGVSMRQDGSTRVVSQRLTGATV